MKMRLYCSKTSPYSRKVRMAVDELGLTDAVEEVLVDPFGPTQEFLTANPLAKIPTLVNERGDALPDSRLILEYLASRYPGLTPLPRGLRRWEVLRRSQLADGVIDAAVATVLEKRRPEGIRYTPWLDRQAAAIQRALDALNTEASFLAAERPGVCEITCGAALAYLDFRLPYLEWRKNRNALADWLGAFQQRPSMQRTQPSPQ
ncbi:MAG: glutathione S-transferase family protein [Gammaproteobacteria bacterium]|nr:glutathione S-transferase family protein [Gammaproteobacteria bacterium]